MTATMRESLPAVTCKPWCEQGDGHTDAWHPDDQWCGSEDTRVALGRMPLIHDGDAWGRDSLRTYLLQEAHEAEAKIHLGRGDAVGVYLTPDEARQLGEALLRLAAMAD